MSRLVLATRNQAKLAELRRILSPAARVELLGLDDLPAYEELPETGATFAENALIKAKQATRHTGLPAVADDSGITVDALNGMPGVLSARWSGRHRDDAANLRLLLEQIADVPEERRGGGFVCAAALALPDGRTHVVRGEVRGRIIREPRGSGGFGYDPIFLPEGDWRTTAELPAAEKDAISHRGKAFRAIAAHIAELV